MYCDLISSLAWMKIQHEIITGDLICISSPRLAKNSAVDVNNYCDLISPCLAENITSEVNTNCDLISSPRLAETHNHLA